CLVVRLLARAVRAAPPPAGRGGDCATLGRPSMALAAEHLRGGWRYPFHNRKPSFSVIEPHDTLVVVAVAPDRASVVACQKKRAHHIRIICGPDKIVIGAGRLEGINQSGVRAV